MKQHHNSCQWQHWSHLFFFPPLWITQHWYQHKCSNVKDRAETSVPLRCWPAEIYTTNAIDAAKAPRSPKKVTSLSFSKWDPPTIMTIPPTPNATPISSPLDNGLPWQNASRAIIMGGVETNSRLCGNDVWSKDQTCNHQETSKSIKHADYMLQQIW